MPPPRVRPITTSPSKHPGGAAHRLSVSACQPPWRAGGRNRRPVRARPWLVHLWGRRSDVALQPQRLGRQDLDPAPDPICRGERRAGAANRPDPLRHPRDRDFTRTRAARGGWRHPVDRKRRRTLRVARFQPLLYDPLRLSTVQDRLSIVARLVGGRARPLAGQYARERQARLHPGRDQTLAQGVPAALLPVVAIQTVSASQWPEDFFGGFIVAARRLAGPVGCDRSGMAARARRRSRPRVTRPRTPGPQPPRPVETAAGKPSSRCGAGSRPARRRRWMTISAIRLRIAVTIR